MTGRRGMTLVELLASLPLIAAVLVLVSALFPALMRDVPAIQRVVETHSGVGHVLKAIRRDVDQAVALPAAAAGKSAGDSTLLIELPDAMVCYQVDQGEITRREIQAGRDKPGPVTNSWSLPGVKISFQLWRGDGRVLAVQIRTAVEHTAKGKVSEKLANTHLLFVGVLQPVEEKP